MTKSIASEVSFWAKGLIAVPWFMWKNHQENKNQSQPAADERIYENQSKKTKNKETFTRRDLETFLNQNRQLKEEWSRKYIVSEDDRRHYLSEGPNANRLSRILLPSGEGTMEVTSAVNWAHPDDGKSKQMSAHVHPLSDVDAKNPRFTSARSEMMSELDTKMSTLNAKNSSSDWIHGPEEKLNSEMQNLTAQWSQRYPDIEFNTHTPSKTITRPATTPSTSSSRGVFTGSASLFSQDTLVQGGAYEKDKTY